MIMDLKGKEEKKCIPRNKTQTKAKIIFRKYTPEEKQEHRSQQRGRSPRNTGGLPQSRLHTRSPQRDCAPPEDKDQDQAGRPHAGPGTQQEISKYL